MCDESVLHYQVAFITKVNTVLILFKMLYHHLIFKLNTGLNMNVIDEKCYELCV